LFGRGFVSTPFRVDAPPAQHVTAASIFPVVVLAVIWGCNWPVMKMGVTEFAPLTFRALTLPFAALGMLAIAKLGNHSIRVPRALWGKIAVLALLNVSAWNGLVMFGVQQLPAGRSSIIAFTMPLWSVLFSLALLHEPLSKRKVAGIVFGMCGMALLLGDDLKHVQRTPLGALLILGAAIGWALGAVLLRKWRLPLPQNAISGWMMLAGWIPLVILAPFFAPGPPGTPSATGWFAIFYNIFLAGTLAHWAWFTLVRTLPIAVASMSALPVPIVGVFSGMLLLGERPGPSEWGALLFVVAALVAVLWAPKSTAVPVAPEN